MIIGIDGTPLSFSHHCGIKHYAENLVFNLASIDKRNEYIIFSPKTINLPKQKNFHLVKYPSFLPFLKRQFFLGLLARKEHVDVFHYLEPYGSVFFRFPKIVTTVHDLDLFKVYPASQNIKYLTKLIYCLITRRFVFKRTKIFIAVSNSVSEELKNLLGKTGHEAVIKVIYESSALKSNLIKGKNENPRQFFLCMGDFSPRKNIPNLLKAYSGLSESVRDKYRMKIIVSTEEASKNFSDISRQLHITKYIDIIVNLTDNKLMEMYRSAFAFCYVSTYEGFGMPIIEAMSLGCPVIASEKGAIKEVAKDAAILVDPQSLKDISEAMKTLIGNHLLRSQLVEKGFKRSRSFSWNKTARQTISLYTDLLKTEA